MCGITGYINLSNKKEPINQSHLKNMQQSLSHRGPNDAGLWTNNTHQIGLAHTRLSIIDLSEAGHQPMTNKNQSVIVCFNGEIYNYKELRTQLSSLGHTFVSQSDTEILIHGYEEWGIKILDKLDGMFAIALFDTNTQELFLIRDRIGIKPLYFSPQNGFLSFASEIKALWQLPWNKRKICDHAFYHYLTFMVTPAPYTIYTNVYKLPAGFYAKIKTNTKQMSFHEWYNPLKTQKEPAINDERFYIEKIRHLLRESTKNSYCVTKYTLLRR